MASDMIGMRRSRKDVALGVADPSWGAGKDDDAKGLGPMTRGWWGSWEEEWFWGRSQVQSGCGEPRALSPTREPASSLEKEDRKWEETGGSAPPWLGGWECALM